MHTKIPIDNNSTINSPVNKDSIDSAPGGAPALSDEEKKYIEGMKRMYPRLMRMDQPLTLEQARKLKERFGEDMLRDVMEQMENWKPLTSKRVSAYRTIIDWCNKETERS